MRVDVCYLRFQNYNYSFGGFPRVSTTLQVELPLSLSKDEAKLLLAVKLFEVGKVSLGQAAKMAGFSKRSFMEVLGRHNVPVINYPAEDLSREIRP